jgi:hypothetical protein
MPQTLVESDRTQKAEELYRRLRPEVETPDRIGQMIVMDLDSGDYEIDSDGIKASYRLQRRHPDSRLFALRIGYLTAFSFAGGPERRC